MAKSLAQKMANRRYRDKVYDQITIEVPKGKRDEYKAAADDLQMTFKSLVQSGIEEYIAKHAGEVVMPVSTTEPDKLSAEDKRLVEEFSRLPVDARKHLMKFVAEINRQQSATD